MGRYGEVAIARSGLLIVEEDRELKRRPRWATNMGGTHMYRQLHSLGFFSSITRDYYRVFLFSLSIDDTLYSTRNVSGDLSTSTVGSIFTLPPVCSFPYPIRSPQIGEYFHPLPIAPPDGSHRFSTN